MSSRENSPDWLRSFEPPTKNVVTLSSASESSLNDSPLVDEDTDVSPERLSQLLVVDTEESKFTSMKASTSKEPKEEQPTLKKRINKGNARDAKELKHETSERNVEAPNSSVWALSSDSDTAASPRKEAPKGKSPKKVTKAKGTPKCKKGINNDDINTEGGDDIKGEVNGGDVEAPEEDVAEKPVQSRFSSSRLPLVLSDKVSRTKALVECEGDSIDLSGDVGAVGRVVVSDEMYIDLKGTIYKTTIVPCRTFCVVNFGPSEAKIEAIMNDFIQLKPQSNVDKAETMVEGTLDGFSFSSDDEADKIPKAATDQNEENGEKSTANPNKRKSEKTTSVPRKKAKTTGGKAPKKVKPKAQASKKGKGKK